LPPAPRSSVDSADIAQFERLGDAWWDPRGPMKALHQLNPVRLAFIRDMLVRARLSADGVGRPSRDRGQGPVPAAAPAGLGRPLAGLTILDIGCGGGILSEPLTRLGAHVTGIDPAAANIEVAKRHAQEQGLMPAYRAGLAEDLVREGASFDAVLAMEVVEHVPDMPAFVAAACALVRPGGILVASTLNRTLKSFALAVVGAEYVLGWLPKGTHRWERFVTPGELAGAAAAAGVRITSRVGVVYDPFRGGWRIGHDTDVNYMVAGRKR
jgi:2-polyprenyl-6-hydroxyphenyl methylase/3-demethylubiquinone-9 3-methyltransferase